VADKFNLRVQDDPPHPTVLPHQFEQLVPPEAISQAKRAIVCCFRTCSLAHVKSQTISSETVLRNSNQAHRFTTLS